MCFQNGEEIKLTWAEWKELYPDGPPDCFCEPPPFVDDSLLKQDAPAKDKPQPGPS
jgi:hypothetical protein